MDAKELIRAGRLSEARTQSIEEVKASPADAGKRTLLFQIHCLCGEWDKAERDLDIIAAMDVKREAGVQVYKNLVSAEKERLEIFRSNLRPSFIPGTPAYIETYYAAREKLVGKKIEEAAELFNRVDSQTPVISGTINGKDFAGIKDTDIYVSRFLEAFAHERYIWVPFEAVRELTITPPKTLFDLIWAPAVITTWKGLALNCFLPVLYAESFLNEDDHIKLGRITDWEKLGGPFDKGMGQHVYEIGGDEVAILEIREMIFNPPAEVKDEKKD
ncbi:MAG: type VI secretion system accessory protein TagJ [Nitrospirota bacterium]